jgi:hypothetical protein
MTNRCPLIPFLLALTVSGWLDGCASSPRHLAISIRVTADTVLLRRYSEGASFNTRVIVQNKESRPLYVVGCGPTAERDVAGTWTQVFTSVCMQELSYRVAPKDSTLFPVTVYGSSAVNTAPRVDPRAEPGRYRLVFGVTAATPDPSTGFFPPSSSIQRTASEPFILKD